MRKKPPCEICGEAVRYVEEYAGGFKVFEYEPCARCDLGVPDETDRPQEGA